MRLVVSGVSHRTGDVGLRDRLAFPEESLPEALTALRERIADAGAVIVSTCNRLEIYVNHAGEPVDLHHEIREFIRDWHGVSERELAEALYEYHDREAIGHLFRVASSLDSMVVGEDQILGQVRDAGQHLDRRVGRQPQGRVAHERRGGRARGRDKQRL